MITHMVRVHGHSWDKAKEIVDSTGIYVPKLVKKMGKTGRKKRDINTNGVRLVGLGTATKWSIHINA